MLIREPTMQQLSSKLKNTPRNVKSLLVPCSVNPVLNRDQSLSVQDGVAKALKLNDNTPEGVRSQHEGSSDSRVQNVIYAPDVVFVLNKRGKPLMPASQQKANKLLKEKKAHVVKRTPFTIQLDIATGETKQPIEMSEDSAYGNIGVSCFSAKREFVAKTVQLDNKMTKRLITKKMYRNHKRSRLWYREPRWKNRPKAKGWLAPSVQHRYDTHINLFKRFEKILPITDKTIEAGPFNIQKIINTDISGTEYQQGDMYGYQNMRAYLIARENNQCQVCNKEFQKGQKISIHHCKQRKEAGTNRAANLAIMHKKCHDRLHTKGLKISAPQEYKAETFMSILNKRIREDMPEVKVTYGYETFVRRNELGLEKSHVNDAFVAGGGDYQIRCKPGVIVQRHRHNRSMQKNRKGFKPSIKTHIYKIQPKDLIWIEGKKYKVVGMHGCGKYVIVENNKNINTKHIDKIYTARGLV